jgi:hypothetical protein
MRMCFLIWRTHKSIHRMSAADSAKKLDELCVRMLSLGAMGGCGGGTDHLKASEIKTLLAPFFGLDRVNRCTAVLCGENAQSADTETQTDGARLAPQPCSHSWREVLRVPECNKHYAYDCLWCRWCGDLMIETWVGGVLHNKKMFTLADEMHKGSTQCANYRHRLCSGFCHPEEPCAMSAGGQCARTL